MTDHIYLYVFDTALGERAQLFHRDLPTPAMLKPLGRVIFCQKLAGRWAEADLDALMAEYRRRRDAGTLPASNIAPPKSVTAQARNLQ